MTKFNEKVKQILTKVSESFAQSVTLNIISSSFMMILPVIIIGSIAALLKGIDIGGYQKWLMSSGIAFYKALATIYQFTTGFMAIFITFSVGYQYANRKNINKQAITIGILSVVSFLIVTPYTVADKKTFSPLNLPFSWLGVSGMFLAIVVGFLVGIIFKFCIDKDIRIKLPEAVPQEVSNQFSALIPGVITITFFAIVDFLFGLTPFGNVQDAVYALVRIPLGFVGKSVVGYYFIIMFMYLLWFFGIHGGMTVGPIIMMIFMPLQLENLAAYQAGQALPHAFVGTHISVGTGSLALLVAGLIVCKSKSNRSIIKLALIPAFFGVDEPAYFGLPMILNPIFFIPWVIVVPALQVFGTYFLQLLKLVPYCNGAQIFGSTPFFLINLMTYQWQGCIAGLVFFVLAVCVYLPFMEIYDKQCLEKEESEIENS